MAGVQRCMHANAAHISVWREEHWSPAASEAVQQGVGAKVRFHEASSDGWTVAAATAAAYACSHRCGHAYAPRANRHGGSRIAAHLLEGRRPAGLGAGPSWARLGATQKHVAAAQMHESARSLA